MSSIRRNCHRAFQSRAILSIPSTTTRRAFSQTPIPHRSGLPVFLPPSTPVLSELLSKLNSKILLPQHLTKEQEDLVYKVKNRPRLEADPIEITLGEVTLALEHIDRNRDVPHRRKHLYQIIEQSKTKEDWENVIRVMEGYESAGIHMRIEWQEKIVKKMRDAGMQHLILKALQRANATGVRLRNWGVVVAVLGAVRSKAAAANWEKEHLEKALKLAEQVVELMEHNDHLGKAQGEADYRTHPAVIAAPLELAAELAYRHDGDMEKVKKYAGRLMKGLQQKGFFDAEGEVISLPFSHLFSCGPTTTNNKQNTTAQLLPLALKRPSDYQNFFLQSQDFFELARDMEALIPIWNGLSTARTVLDAEMPMPTEAEKVQKALRAALDQGLETLTILSKKEGAPAEALANELTRVRDAIEKCLDEGEDGAE